MGNMATWTWMASFCKTPDSSYLSDVFSYIRLTAAEWSLLHVLFDPLSYPTQPTKNTEFKLCHFRQLERPYTINTGQCRAHCLVPSKSHHLIHPNVAVFVGYVRAGRGQKASVSVGVIDLVDDSSGVGSADWLKPRDHSVPWTCQFLHRGFVAPQWRRTPFQSIWLQLERWQVDRVHSLPTLLPTGVPTQEWTCDFRLTAPVLGAEFSRTAGSVQCTQVTPPRIRFDL